MKKNCLVFLFILILSTAFTACNFNFKGDELLDPFDVDASGGPVVLSIPSISKDTKYIHIYRKEVVNKKDVIVNLGILYPAVLDAKNIYIFIDELVKKGNSYSYMARYFDGTKYEKTNWSKEVQPKDGYSDTQSLVYTRTDAQFEISSDYIMTLTGTLKAPDITDIANYKPMLIAKTSKKTEVFELSADISSEKGISLKNILPADFYDTEITIVGILAQKINYVDSTAAEKDKVVRSVLWTDFTEIPVKDNKNKTITIKTTNVSDGLDYTRQAAAEQAN